MAHPSRKFWTMSLSILAIAGLVTGILLPFASLSNAQAATPKGSTTPPYVSGPFTEKGVYPYVFNGDLRDLPQRASSGGGEVPAPRTFKQANPAGSPTWVDPVTQQSYPKGQMPEPIVNFEGLDLNDGGGWHPPDTNGDVGPNNYIQTVNIAIGIWDKDGNQQVNISYDNFFEGTGTPCDNDNTGDVVVLYDPQVDRWIITDFSWLSYPAGPFYECIAVSQGSDPVAGGWYFYALRADPDPIEGTLNDYPKLGVWSDGWYMSANMFGPSSFFVRVWALDRASAISGGPLNEIYFDCTDLSYCASLLPANIRGTLPPADSPEYFANVMFPNSLNIWQFHTDWETPGNSTFTGPVTLLVANFVGGAAVPQPNTDVHLDSLGDRMMFLLQYRNINGVEALFANHTVLTNGVDGIRWYEVRDPGGTPTLYQQGTYQPDTEYRWMGAIAADKEGNVAVGYSVASSEVSPSIRYTGRLAGEIPGQLTQGEAELIQGTGSQTGFASDRWGDYSSMTVDPTDDCTFWYTQEYIITTGPEWHTRIGSFKFPSCGAEKGTISGFVRNSETDEPIAGVPVFAQGTEYSYTTLTNEAGFYKMSLIAGNYDMVAGPLLPGYPGTDSASGVLVVVGQTTTQDFHLVPTPSLINAGVEFNDDVQYGNGNGFPEPGEQFVHLSELLKNQGATTSTQIVSKLTSLTEGVTVNTADSSYADIAAGDTGLNLTPYVFSIDPGVVCGSDLNFGAVITDSFNTYTTTFSLNASVPLPRQDVFFNDVEQGDAGWTHTGYPDTWAITTEDSHSPTHSWTDSPGGDYIDNTNNYVRTPSFDLSGKRHVQVSGWFKYALESGFDYVYLDYSLNDGANWTTLTSFNGTEGWHQVVIDAPMLDNQDSVALRFHLISDSGVTADGIHVDDVALSYEPFECSYTPIAPDAPTLVSPANGSSTQNPVTFVWQPAATGMATEGYVFYLDDTAVITFTEPVTTTTLEVSSAAHTWFVKATNIYGASLPSPTWSFDVFGKLFLPLVVK